MLCSLGFNHVWVERLLDFVTTVKYIIRVNGELTEEIVPQQGLRQGDPLSLFVLDLC
jgi:hypothetical protein